MTKKNGCGAFCRCVGEKERLWRAPCATTEFFLTGTDENSRLGHTLRATNRKSASAQMPKRATNETSRHETILPSERAPSHCALRMTSVPSATLTRRPPEASVVKPSSSNPSRTPINLTSLETSVGIDHEETGAHHTACHGPAERTQRLDWHGRGLAIPHERPVGNRIRLTP